MITIIATFAVPEANRERFVELGRRLVAGSREDAGVFAFVEGWADAAAIDAHNASEHFTTLIPRLVELSDEAPVITQYEEV